MGEKMAKKVVTLRQNKLEYLYLASVSGKSTLSIETGKNAVHIGTVTVDKDYKR
jgi:hypothetical protein